MIAKITRGRGFSGAARYVLADRPGLDQDRQAEIVGGNMAGRTATEVTREFEAVRRQRPDIDQPVEHIALSFAHDDRRLTNDEMGRLADEYLRRRGYDPERCQYLVARHHDKGHQHCHILLNRVRPDRSVVPQQHREYLRSKDTCRGLETDYDLRAVSSARRPELQPEHALTRGEDRMKRDRGVESEKERLSAAIRGAAQGRPTMSEFVRRLEAGGVQIRANIARTGHVSGISYRLDHVAVKGSRLGRAYSFEGVQRELGVRYEANRDLPALQRVTHLTRGYEPAWRHRYSPAARLARRLTGRLAARVPGLRELGTVTSLARDLKNLTRSPSRTAVSVLTRALSPSQQLALVARTLVDLSRRR